MSRIGTTLRKCSFSRPTFRVTTSPAFSRTRRCFMTPNLVIASLDSSSVSVRPSRASSWSSRSRRVGSASALNTRSSSAVMETSIGDQMVTCQPRVYRCRVFLGDVLRSSAHGDHRRRAGDRMLKASYKLLFTIAWFLIPLVVLVWRNAFRSRRGTLARAVVATLVAWVWLVAIRGYRATRRYDTAEA